MTLAGMCLAQVEEGRTSLSGEVNLDANQDRTAARRDQGDEGRYDVTILMTATYVAYS